MLHHQIQPMFVSAELGSISLGTYNIHETCTVTSYYPLQLHLYPVAFIIEMLALILYTKQERFKFTHIRGVLLIYLIFGLLLAGGYLISWYIFFKILIVWGCTFEAWYIIYDTYLMLCGHHSYNVGPHEYIYAVCNIHVDLPKFVWIILIQFVFGPIRGFVKFFRKCRTTSIC